MRVDHPHQEHSIQLPSPTAWPVVLALGIALVLSGMVTSGIVSILGGILAVAAIVGWFRQVLPHEAHEAVDSQHRRGKHFERPNACGEIACRRDLPKDYPGRNLQNHHRY